jgi:integrase
VTTNPVLKVRRPSLPKPAPKALSLDDVHQVVAACAGTTHPDRNKAILALLLDTGLRRAELAALQVGDVDLPARLVTVRLGKGGKGRRVPISSMCAHVLAEWLVARPVELGNSFFGLKGNGLQMLFRRLAARSGVHFFCHALRHTFATLYEGDVQDLQKILGHSEVSTTAEIYRCRETVGLVRVHDERSPLARIEIK